MMLQRVLMITGGVAAVAVIFDFESDFEAVSDVSSPPPISSRSSPGSYSSSIILLYP